MDCKLNLSTGYKYGGSYVKNLYVTLPFRVVSVGQRKLDKKLYQMVMSSSPGILDGDNYHLNIEMENGSCLQLQSQSYQRLFNMRGKATQQLKVKMEDNTSFAYCPHPIVPHKDSNFKSESKIEMGRNSQIIIGEIITCGRKHHGEVFELKRFQNITEIYVQGKLVVKDNVLMEPALIPLNSLGNLEGFTHQGTMIFITSKTGVEIQTIIDFIFSEANRYKDDMEVGISELEGNGFMLRALGHGGEIMYQFFLVIQDLLWERE